MSGLGRYVGTSFNTARQGSLTKKNNPKVKMATFICPVRFMLNKHVILVTLHCVDSLMQSTHIQIGLVTDNSVMN